MERPTKLDELAYKLYHIDIKKHLYTNSSIDKNNFIIFDFFYKEYYKKAKVLLRKEKIKKLLKNGYRNI